MADRTLTVRLRAIATEYSKVLDEAGRSTDRLGDKTDALQARAKRMTGLGKTMMRDLTVPLAAGGVAIVKVAGDYESSLRDIQAVSQSTAGEMAMLSGLAKRMGADTQFSAKQAADGLVELMKAGFNAQQAYEALPPVMQLATAGSISIAEAATTATNVMAGFGLQVGDLARVNDVLAQGANQTTTDVSELAEAFKMVGPVARSQNMSLEETTAILGVLANNGIRGTMAGTELRGMIGALISPSGEAADALARLGISVLDASGNLLPMPEIVRRFTQAGATSADVYQVFGRETAGAFSALLGTGAPALAKMNNLMTDSVGVAQNLADAKMGGLSGSIEQLKGSIEGLAIAAGEAGASDFISALANGGAKLANVLSELPPWLQKTSLGIGAIALASGPAIWAVGKLGLVYGPAVRAAQGFITKLQALRLEFAMTQVTTQSTGQTLLSMFGPQAAVIAGVAALAGVLYYAHQQAEEFKKSHVDAGDAAMTLAKSAHLATSDIDSLSDSEKKATATAQEFADANQSAILTLRAFANRDLQQGFLIQLGYELVLRGAKPSEAFAQIQRLAKVAGVEVPVSLTVENIGDFQNQVKAATDQARGVVKDLGTTDLSHRGLDPHKASSAIADLDRIAHAAARAFKTQGPEAFAAVLAGAEKQLGSTSSSMDYLTDQSLKYTEVSGLSTESVHNTAGALTELSSHASSAGDDSKEAFDKLLAAAAKMEGGVTAANLAAAAAAQTAGKSATDYGRDASDAAAQADKLAAAGTDVDRAMEAGKTASDLFADALKKVASNSKLSTLELDANAAAAEAFSKSIDQSSSLDNLATSGLSVGSALHDLQKGLTGESSAADKSETATDRAAKAVGKLGDALTMTDPKLSRAAISMGALGAAADAYAQSIADSTGLDDQVNAALDMGDAARDFSKAIRRLPGDIQLTGAALASLRPRQREAVRDVTKLGAATTQYLSTLLKSGRGTDEVRKEAARLRDEYVAQMRAAGMSEEAIARYVEVLGLTPKQVDTAIKVSGTEAARFQINAYLQLLEGRIPENVATQVTAAIDRDDLTGAARILADWVKTHPQKIEVDPKVDNTKKIEIPHDFSPVKAAMGVYSDAETAGVQALQKLGSAMQDYLDQLVGAGQVDEARRQAEQFRQSLHDQLSQLGLNEGEIQKYFEMLGLTPRQIDTAITLSGTELARFQIETYTQLMGDQIPPEKRTEILALIDQGKLTEAAAALAAWRESESNKPISVPVVPTVMAWGPGGNLYPRVPTKNPDTGGRTSATAGTAPAPAPSAPDPRKLVVMNVHEQTASLPVRDFSDAERSAGWPEAMLKSLDAGNVTGIVAFFQGRGARIPGWATGGAVDLPPGLVDQGPAGGDQVTARVQRGEYLITEPAVRKLGVPFLDVINTGKVPRLGHERHSAISGDVATETPAGWRIDRRSVAAARLAAGAPPSFVSPSAAMVSSHVRAQIALGDVGTAASTFARYATGGEVDKRPEPVKENEYPRMAPVYWAGAAPAPVPLSQIIGSGAPPTWTDPWQRANPSATVILRGGVTPTYWREPDPALYGSFRVVPDPLGRTTHDVPGSRRVWPDPSGLIVPGSDGRWSFTPPVDTEPMMGFAGQQFASDQTGEQPTFGIPEPWDRPGGSGRSWVPGDYSDQMMKRRFGLSDSEWDQLKRQPIYAFGSDEDLPRFARGGAVAAGAYSLYDHRLSQNEVFSAIKWFGTMMAKRLYLLKRAGLENAFNDPRTPLEVRQFDAKLSELGTKSPGIFHFAQMYAQSHPWTDAGPTPDTPAAAATPPAEPGGAVPGESRRSFMRRVQQAGIAAGLDVTPWSYRDPVATLKSLAADDVKHRRLASIIGLEKGRGGRFPLPGFAVGGEVDDGRARRHRVERRRHAFEMLPGRANGGAVAGGETVRTLEHGRAELFTPNIPGTITPVNQLMTHVPSAGPPQRLDRRDLEHLASLLPEGGVTVQTGDIVSPNPRRSAEDLVRSTDSALYRHTRSRR